MKTVGIRIAAPETGRTNRRTLRFGIRAHSPILQAWETACVRQLLALDGAIAAFLLLDPPPTTRPARGPRARLDRVCNAILLRGCRAAAPTDSSDLFAGAKHIHLADESAADALRAADLDFLLWFGEGPPPLHLRNMPRGGIWSFRHGQPTDGPAFPCLQEVRGADRAITATLDRWTDEPEGRVTLRWGVFKGVPQSYARTRDNVQFGTSSWPAQVYGDATARGEWHAAPAFPAVSEPGFRRAALSLPVVLTWRTLTTAWARAFRHDVWNVGIVDAPIAAFLTPGAQFPVRWLPRLGRSEFAADPFMLPTAHAEMILVEGFDYRHGAGYIALMDATDAFRSLRPVITEPFHMSYPYAFAHDGAVYCVPETSAAREVWLYRAVALPYRWERYARLIADFGALDSTLIRHEGRWWLFCAEQTGTEDTPLHAWYADDLCGPWLPHAANPLKTDIRSSRPAGTPFIHEGQLYRPAQDCSGTYGGAVTINHVLRLTPTAFAEEPVMTVAPTAGSRYPDGLHTLSAFGDRTLVDGKCRRFVPHEATRLVRVAIHRTVGRSAGSILRRLRMK